MGLYWRNLGVHENGKYNMDEKHVSHFTGINYSGFE